MRKLYYVFLPALLCLVAATSFAQITLSGTSYTQNFDNIGAGLPTGWTIRTGATAAALGNSLSFTATANTWSNTTGAFKNLASADGLNSLSTTADQNASTDRALGLRQSGSFGDPGGAFVMQLANTNGFANFTLSFQLQSLDATSPRPTTWQVDYGFGPSPTSFTSLGNVGATGGTTFSNNTVNVNFGTALNDINQPVWIRIVALNATPATPTGNRATSGIDDIALNYTTSGTPLPTTVSVTAGANAAEPSSDGSFTVSLSTVSATDITINYDFTGSAATLGSDFNDPLGGAVTIPAGQLSATVPIDVIDDAVVEPVEAVTINLTGATSPYTISGGTAAINITSEDISSISFTGAYSLNFDNTLAAIGTASNTPTGWAFAETGNNANTTYAADNGSSNSGNTYSFGTGADVDRAFGGIRSGSLVPSIGALLVNNTGATVTSLTISYTGEQWRLGTTGRKDRLDFQYSTATTAINTGAWVDADGLDFIAPNGTSGTDVVGPLNGNDAANKKVITYTINGLSIPIGATFGIRWQDFDVAGAEDGLAIDDIFIGLGCTPPDNQPAALNLTPSLQSVSGSFTAAANGSTNADAYLVLVSTAPVLSAQPTSGTAYAIDDVIGNARVISIDGNTSFTASGLTPSTQYYFFVYSTNTDLNCYNITTPLTGNVITEAPPACIAPTTQVSALAAAIITGTSMDLTWTRGNGDNVLVIAHSGTPVSAIVYNSLSYPTGTEVSPGNFVIYNGPAAAFAYTGLSQNTTYHFALYEYSSATNCYTTPALTGNFTTLCTNPVNVSALTGTAGNSQVNVAWALPATACFDEVIVVASTAPVAGVGSDYPAPANPAYTSGEQVVYRGTSTHITVTGLTNNTIYYFKVFTRKGTLYSDGIQITAIPFDPASGYMYLFGNLHAHSSYSDGNKDNTAKIPQDDYTFARDALCMDFLGISEHNHSGAGMSKPNYGLGFAQANSLNGVTGPGGNSLVTLWGMEWGVISGGGHVLVYGFDDKLVGWEPGNYDLFVAKNDYPSLWTTVNAQSGAIATLAHPNNTDYSNLASAYSATADAAITGTAIESGPAFSTSTTYNDFPGSLSYLSYYRTMLARGYHLAPQMDQDNHNMTFGTANANRMVVLSPTRSREGIMEAIRSMRYYASQDCNTRVDFRSGGQPMGSLINSAGVPQLSLTVTDPDMEAVTAIELWGGPTGSTTPVAPIITATNAATFSFTSSDAQNVQPDTSTWSYNVVITQEDGNKIVTAPIWYTRNDLTLPITLTSLKARYIEDNNEVAITWSTSQESNSKAFVVERSGNGTNFTAIGTVAAAGNSNRPLNYSFTDKQPLMGSNYYRLRQVDLDGEAHNSGIVKVVIGKGLYVSYGPNPASQFLSINIQNNKGPITVQLTDLNGRLLQQRSLPATATQTIQLPVNRLSKGMYLLKVTSTEGIMTEKIMIQ
jgi:hypothetical protein